MLGELHFRNKLRTIEALFADAGTPVERDAAEAALERIRARLGKLERKDHSIEMQFSLFGNGRGSCFLAPCRRYRLKSYRLYRQRLTIVMLEVPSAFLDQVLRPEFQKLNGALKHYLNDVTNRIILDQVHRDTSEAPAVTQKALTQR